MKAPKEHNIGEVFENCKIMYEVREGFSCKGCALLIEEENHCTDQDGNRFEPCSQDERTDGKSVIFVQIGEVKD